MATYSYVDCLERSYKVNWKIKDVLGNQDFDLSRPWLPAGLSGGSSLSFLDEEEKRKLTHVEMGAYAHLFGFVEAFIAPEMVALARDSSHETAGAFEALTNFASEEIKHMHLFQEIRRRVDNKLGFELELLAGQQEVAQTVLSRHRGAVLLLTAAIEWLTQHHYLSAMRHSDELDPLTKEIFRFHWMEEAQHAQLDHLEAMAHFKSMGASDRDAAVEDLIWLLVAVDGLLQQQVGHDVVNASRYLGRVFTAVERQEVRQGLLKAKRHCFIESGVSHPNFQELFLSVTTPDQQARVQDALTLILHRGPGH
ncbi:hypothetical protein GETHLI_30570 [Geothrix limicola]|uniref:Uncharacterized protein n=1 Tax=Geothrix limicola TaxID=2927978 RepID=A0ABQ5QK62_9BACT|nr:diiron oxygenase [Geothrix limicola]GLH74555.1 hypothetical protein GETHLI_30570 [Geothrix limicola]